MRLIFWKGTLGCLERNNEGQVNAESQLLKHFNKKKKFKLEEPFLIKILLEGRKLYELMEAQYEFNP